MKIVVEICVEGVASAIEAEAGGADRVELCQNLAVGGVTPGPGAIAVACRAISIPIHVLVRPRGGDFVPSPSEFESMEQDVRFCREQGASGVVLGVLTSEGRVDRERTARLVELAGPLSVTFHKAFDAARDPFEALDDLIDLGVDRILTSGGPSTARSGIKALAGLVDRARGRVVILAGGSIVESDIQPLIEANLTEIHLGSAATFEGRTDRDRVSRIIRAASDWEIVHLTTRSDWNRATAEGSYRAGSLETEGFIHASLPGQVAGSANRFYRGRTDLIALRIKPLRVVSPIRFEASTHSDRPFPHIYGPLNPDAVSEVIAMTLDSHDDFTWSSEA